MCSRRENAAVVSPEPVLLRTERDPSVLAACECRMQQSFRRNMSVFARGERSKCAHGVNAAVLSVA